MTDELTNLATPMWVEVCPDCGLYFQLPLDFYLARQRDKVTIHCPAGHVIPPADDTVTNPNVTILCIELRTELRQLRQQLTQAQAALARMPQPAQGPITDAEFKRRIELLVSRAELSPQGQPICRLCGKLQSSSTHLRGHLKRAHRTDVIEMSSVFFD